MREISLQVGGLISTRLLCGRRSVHCRKLFKSRSLPSREEERGRCSRPMDMEFTGNYKRYIKRRERKTKKKKVREREGKFGRRGVKSE